MAIIWFRSSCTETYGRLRKYFYLCITPFWFPSQRAGEQYSSLVIHRDRGDGYQSCLRDFVLAIRKKQMWHLWSEKQEQLYNNGLDGEGGGGQWGMDGGRWC